MGNKDETKALIDMKKRRKKVRPKNSHPEQDHFLIRIKRGERLYNRKISLQAGIKKCT